MKRKFDDAPILWNILSLISEGLVIYTFPNSLHLVSPPPSLSLSLSLFRPRRSVCVRLHCEEPSDGAKSALAALPCQQDCVLPPRAQELLCTSGVHGKGGCGLNNNSLYYNHNTRLYHCTVSVAATPSQSCDRALKSCDSVRSPPSSVVNHFLPSSKLCRPQDLSISVWLRKRLP